MEQKANVRIMADSTCDLTKELLERYGITILPLHIVLDMQSYCDLEQITPDEIYSWAEANKKTPKTAAVAIDRAMEALRPMKEAGADVIFFGISEDMSTTCNVVRLAAQELEYDRVFVVDSMSLSTGIGLQVLRAAQMAKRGIGAEEIVAQIESARAKVRASFVVERLDYLAMGGRCSSVAALLGARLKLKPRIDVINGKMQAGKKYRGPQDKVIVKYTQDMEEALLAADPERVFITHSGHCEEAVAQVKAYLESLHQFKEIYVTRAGGVISSHCGPGTLGVLFYEK